MKLGVRAHDYGKHEIEDLARILHNAGFGAAQVALPRAFAGIESFDDVNDDMLCRIREAFTREQVEISVLSCYQDLGNPDEEIRRNAVNQFKRCLSFAKKCGAKMVGSETSYAHLSKLDKHIWFPYMMKSLVELKEEAEKIDQLMAIEPVAWHPLEDVETTVEVLERLNSSHVKVIFDMANVLERPAEINQPVYWEKCFAMLDKYIETIHLKDFRISENGEYLGTALGEGLMDYGVFKKWLEKHENIPVMREEMSMDTAAQDIEFMRRMGKVIQ